MKGGKDEGKLMDPLFPRLHIDDADKGGPKAPPRNKMAMLPIQPTNDHTSSLPQASSSQVGHRLATFCGLPGSSHLAEIYQSYYSTAVNVKTPLGNSEPSELESSNYQNPCVSGNSRTKSNSLRPHGFDEVSEFDDKALVPAKHHKKHSLVDEPCQDSRIESKAVTDAISGMPERIMRRTCAPAMDDSLSSFPTHRDGYGLIGTATINECYKDEDCGPMQGEDAGKKQETLDTSVAECTPVVDLTPDDVVGIIGQKLFWKARNIIVRQQRTFTMQIFELHRLIKVQRLIAGSLQVFSENIFNLNVKPSTKFPPTKKLLFTIPLNPSPVVTKRKVDALNPGKHHRAEAEGDFAQQPTPKPSPTPPTNYNAKVAPWCFHPPGNQWLSPAESPSEGLIHEPYKGLGPPTPSIMGPVFGHQQPVNISTMGKTVYGVPAVDFQGTRHFPGGAFGESCLRPYVMPLINPHSPVLDLNQTIPFAGAQSAGTDKVSLVFDANVAISCKTSCNMVNQSSLVVLDSGEILHGPQADWWQEDALFPTTAAVLCSKDHYNQSLQVIKVVPHDPKSARESAARIFQSIQEERNIT
ncbi:ELF3-like protein 2 [Sesamum indicum]|uniref:ELF3-like protein 2 n=1 Tax=Sesamum indicum TaxID=4182 RepID=A0A6I9SXT0_SESIN|nr:ELF3-like protein 2 [Sesamum indicum]